MLLAVLHKADSSWEAAENDYVEKRCTTEKHEWVVEDSQLLASVGNMTLLPQGLKLDF